MYFSPDDKRRIKDISENHLLDVISDFITLEKRPHSPSYTGKCPMCNEAKGFEFNEAKKVYSCFKCNNISGSSVMNFLMKGQNKTYIEASEYLVQKFNIILDPKPEKKKAVTKKLKKKSKENKGEDINTFCAKMLAESGLTYADVTAHVYQADEHKTIFQQKSFCPGTLNEKNEIDKGDDVIIKYYNLDGFPVTYEVKDHKGRPTGRTKEYYRVRWQYPDAHLDKDGKPFKYKSPYGGGTPIYIPERLRALYKGGNKIQRLFIQEGEKKAEKACKHGLPSIAISGIQNLGSKGTLPEDVVRIIDKCQVEEVIFLMDSDWNDISENIKINDSVDKRPRNFFYACRNYKEYMRSLKNREIYVEIYIGHTKKNDVGDKGIDDLLSNTLAGKEDDLLKDLELLINEKNLTGNYLQLYKITTWTDHKLEELWCLNSPQKFTELHKDILRNLPEFRIGKHRWRINESGKLESAQSVESDEQFWAEIQKKDRNGDYRIEYEFKYVRSRRFLQNRGFGRFQRLDGTFQFVHLTPPTVKIIEASEARDFLFEFAEANCNEDVNEMISKGVTQYVGPDKLSLLKFIQPNFLQPSRDYQYFYFEKNCWKINTNKVESVGYENISHHIWENQRKQYPYKYIGKPLISFNHSAEGYTYTLSPEGKKTQFLQFLINASNFTWRKERAGASGETVEITDQEKQENIIHLLSKLCAIGYLMMECKDPNVARAVIGMDGKQSEVGESNGRSGKSLIGELMRNVMPIAYIDGKKRDMFNDNFLWNDVVENTRCVFIDDVTLGFNFESLFPCITGDWNVNYKGGRRITFPFPMSPKIYIATNHTIRGSGSSFSDRQWLLAFSDYYNDQHKPIDDFECLFFSEWDFEQWNLCWNMLACCVQLYLKYGVVQAPGERLEQRKLRQEITEVFISWADEYFSSSDNLNKPIARKILQDAFFDYDPMQRKYVTPTEFKKRFIRYCKWKGFVFNPQMFDSKTGRPYKFDREGKPVVDHKTGGVEFFTVGDENYSNPETSDKEEKQNKISF